jgi:hypothetical protein
VTFVQVTLDPEGELTPTEVVWTDERGLFELRDLAPGPAELRVEHQDYAPSRRAVLVAPDGRESYIELILRAGWKLVVEVVAVGTRDEIVGARVSAAGQVRRSDDEGKVHFHQIARDRVEVTVRADGRVSQTRAVARPSAAGETAAVIFALDEGAGITGIVQDDRGDPVVGARIEIRAHEGGAVLARTKTAARGIWKIEGLGEGDVIVRATPPPALQSLLAPVTRESDVLRGRVTHNVDLRFERQ